MGSLFAQGWAVFACHSMTAYQQCNVIHKADLLQRAHMLGALSDCVNRHSAQAKCDIRNLRIVTIFHSRDWSHCGYPPSGAQRILV